MAAVTYTAAQIARVNPDRDECYDFVAGVALTKGLPAYIATTGKAGIADANDSSPIDEVRGIVVKAGGAGAAVSVIKRGMIYGFALSGLAYGAFVYLSNTVGTYEDSGTIIVGRVMPLSDSSLTKVLYVDCKWNEDWT
jgi:hypothetical protein